MSRFKDKLSRLEQSGRGPLGNVAEEEQAQAERQRLSHLRAQFEGALGAEESAPVSALEVLRESGFTVGGASGHMVRSVEIPPDAWIGSVRAQAMREASSVELALLGLEPHLAAARTDGLVALDLETTGLGAGAGNVAFVVGLGFWRADRLWVEQHLLVDPSCEAAMLEAVGGRLAAGSGVLSYNGKSFDLPLLRGRFVLKRVKWTEPRVHLDLLHLARRVHRARPWRKTLKEVERRVLGFHRGPDIDSALCGARYAHFLRSHDPSALLDVVRHNEHDITTLLGLCGIYGSPVERLEALDLAGAARAARRFGDLKRARNLADHAVKEKRNAVTLQARAEIAKASGDRDQALADFEALASEVDDPAVRLELAKLYEHHRKDFVRALAMVAEGTSETASESDKRADRIKNKHSRRKRHDG